MGVRRSTQRKLARCSSGNLAAGGYRIAETIPIGETNAILNLWLAPADIVKSSGVPVGVPS